MVSGKDAQFGEKHQGEQHREHKIMYCLCLHTLYLEKVFKVFPKIDVLCVMQPL